MKKELNSKKQYGFPDEAEIERVIKRVTQLGYRRINKGLFPNASKQDKVKHNLCQSIGDYCDDNQLSEQKLAQKLDINQEKLECILFCHINKLTVEELIDYIDKLTGHLEVKVNYDHPKTSARAN